MPLTVRPLISPRLKSDPQLRAWLWRGVITLVVFIAVTIGLNVPYGLTAAVIYMGADIAFRSKTTAVVPPEARVTAAQRSTRRRLQMLTAAGYVALNACSIPGTNEIIDHLVVGPAGVFAVDSEMFDKRLPVRAIGGVLYHGPASMEGRLEHARWEAHRAAALISARLGQQIRVLPVMVVYGPALPWAIMKLKGVDVLGGGHVGTYFRKQSKVTSRHHLDAVQIGALAAMAERTLPPAGAS